MQHCGGLLPSSLLFWHWSHLTLLFSRLNGKSSQATVCQASRAPLMRDCRLGLAWDFSVIGLHFAVWALFASRFGHGLGLMLR